MQKSMRKSMQNGTSKGVSAGQAAAPYKYLSVYMFLVQYTYIRPQAQISKRPSRTVVRGRIYVASDNRPRMLCLVY